MFIMGAEGTGLYVGTVGDREGGSGADGGG